MNKYKMLKGGKILITETAGSRTLLLPLFNRKEAVI
jgi:hypothetical protein